MRILAIETSLRQGSLATLDASHSPVALVAERLLPSDQRSAQSLLPTLSQLCSESDWEPSQIELICVTTGPGSFTGLRIGVTVAKALSFAAGAKLVGVHTLAALAGSAPQAAGKLWAVLDAQRHELFAASFKGADILQYPCTRVLSSDEWLAELKAGDSVMGPPLEILKDRLPSDVTLVDKSLWRPQASLVGRLGYEMYLAGSTVDPMQLIPSYFRKSAAEEKADAATLE